ncbi:hypothetical protein JMJ35_003959, partial [Cladonia borealis]
MDKPSQPHLTPFFTFLLLALANDTTARPRHGKRASCKPQKPSISSSSSSSGSTSNVDANSQSGGGFQSLGSVKTNSRSSGNLGSASGSALSGLAGGMGVSSGGSIGSSGEGSSGGGSSGGGGAGSGAGVGGGSGGGSAAISSAKAPGLWILVATALVEALLEAEDQPPLQAEEEEEQEELRLQIQPPRPSARSCHRVSPSTSPSPFSPPPRIFSKHLPTNNASPPDRYGAGDTFGSPNCNTATSACDWYSNPEYNATVSENLFGTGPGGSTGETCGKYYQLTAVSDQAGNPFPAGAGGSIVVK